MSTTNRVPTSFVSKMAVLCKYLEPTVVTMGGAVRTQSLLPSNQQSRSILTRLYTPFEVRCSTRQTSSKQITTFQVQRRRTHTRRHVSSAAVSLPEHTQQVEQPAMPSASSMSILPLPSLIRSYLITSISSYPVLLRPSLAALSFLAHAKSPLLSPDTNPLLRHALKRTFYAQFCAGETPTEVRSSIAELKSLGYKGVILGHAKEVVMSKDETNAFDSSMDCSEQERCNAEDIGTWKTNTIATIDLAQKDDFVALKFSGAGRQALQHLRQTIPCAPAFEQAVHEMCQRAEQREVKLLFDAEQDALQDGIDNWTMYFAKRYNKGDKALVYGTYQAYKKKTPDVLSRHLALANEESFVLGVKLVRGAYLNSDPRELFWSTIEETHSCYDGIMGCLMKRRYGGYLSPEEDDSSEFPRVDLFLASHNAQSVRQALQLRDQQVATGQPRIRLAYGQLMGMADNVSCELVKTARDRAERGELGLDMPKAYKYVVWGKMGECMRYLLRRAQENKDAVTRTAEARRALGKELARRVGLAR
jgi:proline dehydrogenase